MGILTEQEIQEWRIKVEASSDPTKTMLSNAELRDILDTLDHYMLSGGGSGSGQEIDVALSVDTGDLSRILASMSERIEAAIRATELDSLEARVDAEFERLLAMGQDTPITPQDLQGLKNLLRGESK